MTLDAPVETQSTAEMERNKKTARRWSEELWGRGDLSVADEIIAPDYERHDSGDPFPAQTFGLSSRPRSPKATSSSAAIRRRPLTPSDSWACRRPDGAFESRRFRFSALPTAKSSSWAARDDL